ncbi:helicase [Mangrovactinospora gilvigrisea]|uniref:Helicase n=1 Tax=Mangrovactinospora gilvigrisea TaxID=1428644 RepID=A0A1J7CB12_9ACTN|nr:DEAD/DEAH box helicase [Mangrovactinospora gilvigrisea]OIV38704.1 helicase [Mangrovactinospora gilvigrisea]
MSGPRLRLHPHQPAAVEAIVRGLELPADGRVPDCGLRGQLVSATGTGKTITAAVAAKRLVPHGMIGIIVPTLDLIAQTVAQWRTAGHTAPMVAVCSLGDDPYLEQLDVRCTTHPTRLALWTAGGGPLVVIATYASLVGQDDDGEAELGVASSEDARGGPGVLEQALRGTWGQRMPPFDLLIIDEAHRSSGDAAKAWAAVHDQDRIPAKRRLYMTATPRLWQAPPGSAEQEDGRGRGGRRGRGAAVTPKSAAAAESSGPKSGTPAGLVASMDDVRLFGPVLHELGLMEACERGILAGFEIDVLEIREWGDPGPDADPELVRGRRLAALQAALLTHADAVGARSLMTFHTRTLDALAFARALPETAAELRATDPHTYPKRVGADWLCGEHPAAERREVLARFADGLDEEGWVVDFGILSSCRVLGEGVDIRGTRGVDGVVFADPRCSPVEIVQIIGRGLRQNPGEGKVARLIVPVFLHPGEDPEDMMASSSYRPVVALLQGLRAHDERAVESMVLAARGAGGQATGVLALDPNRPEEEDRDADDDVASEDAAAEAEEQDGAGDAAAADDRRRKGASNPEMRVRKPSEPLLRFSLPRNPDVIAAFLRTRVLYPDSEVWLAGYNALRHWVADHGDARVPLDAVVPLGATARDAADVDESTTETYALGAWVSEQRRAFKLGALKAWRAELLDELGMVWSVADTRFHKNLAAARAYYDVHGTLAAPRDAEVDGVRVGHFLSNLRRTGALAGYPEREKDLRAIDKDWNPGWPADWQRAYVYVKQLIDDGEKLEVLLPGVTVFGDDIGTWITRQQRPEVWDALTDRQQELLEGLGITPKADERAETGDGSWKALSAFDKALAALRQYVEREGTAKVPRGHVEHVVLADGADPVEIRLGVALSNLKSPARRAKLTDHQRAALTEAGLELP